MIFYTAGFFSAFAFITLTGCYASYLTMTVVIDGFVSGAAAIIAAGLSPQVKDYLIAAHLSEEPGHRFILDHLGLKPLLTLNMRLGEGTGAALGISLAEAAVKILAQMATFSEAGVSEATDKEIV